MVLFNGLIVFLCAVVAPSFGATLSTLNGLVPSAIPSHSLRGKHLSQKNEIAPITQHDIMNGVLHRQGAMPAPQSDALAEAYSSGWWYGGTTNAQTCDTDDYGGDNNQVTIEGYALNVCLYQGGFHIKYQCDGKNIVQEVYNHANCTSFNTYYPVESVGCRNNIVYNCTSDNSTLPIPPGQNFVTQLYYATSHSTTQPNCTGQVQYFVGEANEHCFATSAGSQYNEYPFLQVYASHDCTGGFVSNADTSHCAVDETISSGGQISYTHFNTTLIAGPPNNPPATDDDTSSGGNDDFFDDEAALIGVAVGGSVALLLALGAGYYVMTKPSETLLAGAATSA